MPAPQCRAPFPPISVESAIGLVAASWQITPEELVGPRRNARHLRARNALCWVLHRRGMPDGGLQRSYAMIGRILGRPDHSTIIHAVRRTEEIAQRDPAYAAMLAELGTVPWTAGKPIMPLCSTPEDHDAARAPSKAQRERWQRRALDKALAGSVTRRGERLSEDDHNARDRARGSIALRAAILAARPEGHALSVPAEPRAVNAPARSGRGPGTGQSPARGFHDGRIG